MAQKRRRNILEEVKGYRFGRSKKKRQAREAINHAQSHAFAHRRDKKNVMRNLWVVRLNAALKAHGLRYNAFIKTMNDKGILLNRKVLSTIAQERPEAFERLLAKVK